MKKFNLIYLIDDDQTSNHLANELLKKIDLANEIKVFKAGIDAIMHLQQYPEKPDLILLDIHMPLMDGIEFVKTGKGLALLTADTQIIFLTNYQLHYAGLKLMEDYEVIQKPITKQKIMDSIAVINL
ncbi:MAG: response regulator [Cytophagaceae bacterium]